MAGKKQLEQSCIKFLKHKFTPTERVVYEKSQEEKKTYKQIADELNTSVNKISHIMYILKHKYNLPIKRKGNVSNPTWLKQYQFKTKEHTEQQQNNNDNVKVIENNTD